MIMLTRFSEKIVFNLMRYIGFIYVKKICDLIVD